MSRPKTLDGALDLIERLRKELQQTTDAFECYHNYKLENAENRIMSARNLLKETTEFRK